MTDAPPDPKRDAGPSSRRPIASRQTRWARGLASWAVRKGYSPNRISQASIGFAALGFVSYLLGPQLPAVLHGLCLILAALTIQARLVCNLIDGMVAVEGGRGARDGPFWNEAPDRAADLLFLAGAGLAAGNLALGLLAGALAIATAYLRELGRAEGLPPDFSGPFAKQQRMAVLTAGTVVAALYASEWTLTVTLWLIVAGTAATVLRRSATLVRNLKAR
jgi:phosphatidylglycerophosphate synthase